jgi:exoribonuclease-2
MADFDGSVIEYQDGDHLRLACVVERGKGRLQVIDEDGKRGKVADHRVVWPHRVTVPDANAWDSAREELAARIGQRLGEIDLPLLWETVGEGQNEFETGELSALYFDEQGPLEKSAMWRKLASDRRHFKRKGTSWVRRSEQQLEELVAQERQAEVREREREVAKEWLRNALRGAPPQEAPAELRATLDRVENWLYRRSDEAGVEVLLQQVAPFLDANEAAYRALVSGQRLSAEADRYLALSGIALTLPPMVVEAAEALTPYQPPEEPVSADFSLDDPETREVDDALSIARDGDAWRLAIDIADVAHFVKPGDTLDVEAGRRATTAYLPRQSVCMLPERLSCDLASLHEGQVRPAVRFEVLLDDEGGIRQVAVRRVALTVAQRLHYDSADAAMGYAGSTGSSYGASDVSDLSDLSDLSDDTAAKLGQLSALAAALRRQRQSWGALTFERPEWKVRVVGGDVEVKEIDRKSPSRNLVAECMILANSVAARLARDQQIPLIFRTQDAPTEDLPAMEEYDPVLFDQARRLLRPARLSLHPGNHFGLGASPYTQVTSPLRRYADLVMQRQLCAHLAGDALPYTQEELLKVLARAEDVARQVSRAESAAILHYLLVHLERTHKDSPLEAVVLAPVRGGYRVELAKWGLGAFLGTSQPLKPGTRVQAKIRSVDPPSGSLKLSL